MIGNTVSHYQITETLGQVRMGEAFRTHDTSPGHKVSLRFLPDIFSGNPERPARFDREAKLPESLNHHTATRCLPRVPFPHPSLPLRLSLLLPNGNARKDFCCAPRLRLT